MDEEHAGMLEDVKADEAKARAEIERAERESRSDSDLLERLETIAGDHHLAGENARAAFIHAAMRLRSDEAKGDALETLLAEAPITVDTGRAVLRAAATIGSDDPKLMLLVYMHKIREHMLFHGPLADEFVQTASTFSDDHNMSTALFQVLHPYPVPREAVVHALVLARDRMRSDDARQKVLVEVKDHHLDARDSEIEQLYRAVADKMGEDAREEALENLRDATHSVIDRTRAVIIARERGDAEVRGEAKAQARAELERLRAEAERAKEDAKRLKAEAKRMAEDLKAQAKDIKSKIRDADIDSKIDEALRDLDESLDSM
jgi:ribosomal protein S15P/S13E